jgi:peptidoglycan/xylan/chitin deacetylase (PgdA/CDA1 family)
MIKASYRVRRGTSRPQGGRVVAFHEIHDPGLFRSKLIWLKESYHVVSLGDLLSNPDGDKPRVAITFDDGYSSWHEVAAPILEELEIPAVFFVCSGFVGLSGVEAEEFRRLRLLRTQELDPITPEQLRDLSSCSLFEIGSHTVHHQDLARLDPDHIKKEIESDRSMLQEWTSRPVNWFAYPFGSPSTISDTALKIVRKSGFSAAFSLVPKFWKKEGDRYQVGRDGLDIRDPDWLWEAWLSGSYDRIYQIIKAKESIFG